MACCAVAAIVIVRLLSIHNAIQSKLNPQSKPKSPPIQHTGSSCRLSLTGITCAACSSSIQSALSSTPGVINANVSLSLLQAHVLYDPSITNPDALALVIEGNGYGAEILPMVKSWRSDFERADTVRKKDIESWRKSFFSSIFLTIFVVLLPYSTYSTSQQRMFTATFIPELACTCINVVFCAGHIHHEALTAIKARRADMAVLSSLGILLGFLQSCHILVRQCRGFQAKDSYTSFDAISVMITVVLGGRYLKALVSRRALSFTTQLSSLLPPSAMMTSARDIAQDPVKTAGLVPIDFLNPGDWIIVSPGSKMPADGVILRGSSTVSETCITGEISPRLKNPGDEVLTGSTNLDKQLVVRATRTGTNTWLEKALEFITKTDSGRGSIESHASIIIERFVGAVLALAIMTTIIWKMYASAEWSECLNRAATMLLSACPCALGLSIPTCIMLSTASASRVNILLASGSTQLEVASKVRTVIFDKTGTLTLGHLILHTTKISPSWSDSPRRLATWWKAVETLEQQHAKHPVAQALLAESERQLSALPENLIGNFNLEVLDVIHSPGLGVQGVIHSDEGEFHMAIGNQRFMDSIGVDAEKSDMLTDVLLSSKNAVFIAINSKLTGFAMYSDEVKEDAARTINALLSEGFRVGLITGDTCASAQKLANAIGISPELVWSDQKPIDKAHVLEKLSSKYGPVAMVGDNMNDIPAISSASFSICVSHDSEVSSAVAGDAQLFPASSLSADLMRIPLLFSLAKATFKKIRQNLVWAMCYNVIALLFSSGLTSLIHESLVLTPTTASLGMSLSSIYVLANSMQLERWAQDYLGEQTQSNGKAVPECNNLRSRTI